MKTVKEHLQKLPLQKRLQAMENIRRQSYYPLGEEMNNIRKRSDALFCSFVFFLTRQGDQYWYDINRKYYINGN